MSSIKRRFKPLARPSAHRDAKLIVIATEDTKAEPKYFSDLAAYSRNPAVHVEILSRPFTASAPEYVIAMLDQFKRQYHLSKSDELWMVIDVDRWGEKKLGIIAKECIQKNYFLAVSNPCSDLWFLLHLKSPDDYSNETLQEFFENKKKNRRSRLETELIEICGQFSKKNLDTGQFIPQVDNAIKRATRLDTNPEHRWPITLCSRLYRLAERIT